MSFTSAVPFNSGELCDLKSVDQPWPHASCLHLARSVGFSLRRSRQREGAVLVSRGRIPDPAAAHPYSRRGGGALAPRAAARCWGKRSCECCRALRQASARMCVDVRHFSCAASLSEDAPIQSERCDEDANRKRQRAVEAPLHKHACAMRAETCGSLHTHTCRCQSAHVSFNACVVSMHVLTFV